MPIEQHSTGRFVVNGDLDHSGVSALWPLSTLPLTDANGLVQLDLGPVQRLDTSGVAWLLALNRFLSDRNVKLSLDNAPESLQKLSRVSNVEGLLPAGVLPVE